MTRRASKRGCRAIREFRCSAKYFRVRWADSVGWSDRSTSLETRKIFHAEYLSRKVTSFTKSLHILLVKSWFFMFVYLQKYQKNLGAILVTIRNNIQQLYLNNLRIWASCYGISANVHLKVFFFPNFHKWRKWVSGLRRVRFFSLNGNDFIVCRWYYFLHLCKMYA